MLLPRRFADERERRATWRLARRILPGQQRFNGHFRGQGLVVPSGGAVPKGNRRCELPGRQHRTYVGAHYRRLNQRPSLTAATQHEQPATRAEPSDIQDETSGILRLDNCFRSSSSLDWNRPGHSSATHRSLTNLSSTRPSPSVAQGLPL